MKDGTRLVFWLDMGVLILLTFLIIAQQWDFVIALFIALIVMNFFDRWAQRHKP